MDEMASLDVGSAWSTSTCTVFGTPIAPWCICESNWQRCCLSTKLVPYRKDQCGAK